MSEYINEHISNSVNEETSVYLFIRGRIAGCFVLGGVFAYRVFRSRVCGRIAVFCVRGCGRTAGFRSMGVWSHVGFFVRVSVVA